MAKGIYHLVRDGQDLLFLAEWYYGDSAAWTHIYYANLDVYGDDFEMIPANDRVFIPDLETSDIIGYYTGPELPPYLPAPEPGTPTRFGEPEPPTSEKPVRMGALEGAWYIGQTLGGDKTMYLVFHGEGQHVPISRGE